jgi:DeoR/GlpR family transcriptional regulator of sugar metabolism
MIMFAHERRQHIMNLLSKKGRLTTEDIKHYLDVSPATIRRDLRELEQSGSLVRTHGGIMHPAVINGEPIFEKRSQSQAKAKQVIANTAAALIEENQSVFIDSGTTAYAVAKNLAARKDITILTNSIPTLSLGRNDGAKIICIGGNVRISSRSLYGGISLAWMKTLHIDVAIIGASGLHSADGASVPSLEEADMKHYVIERAKTTILTADMTKWNKSEAIIFAAWNDFHFWITDPGLKESEKKKIEQAGVKIHITHPV